MTIVEAIKEILSQNVSGLTSIEIYEAIIQQGLYVFGAKNPAAVVNGEIRRRCKGLDFPTAYPIKLFEIVGSRGKKPKIALLDQSKPPHRDEEPLRKTVTPDLLPEEKIGIAFEEHRTSIKQQVFECALSNSPTFFEHLVKDLLWKMGYGYDDTAGIVTGGSHDGGIDGVISEDKLGLDKIYFQAKRYAVDNHVGRKELQAFIGAMENVQKGVFITTSSYTKEAISIIEKQQQKSIKLIDGELLADLLVRYEVGINTVQTFSLYRIDSDYYVEA